MNRFGFNPFKKPFEELLEDDLDVLMGIPENWYIEYKSKFNGYAKFSKEICAFANQQGGLIFIGIEEEDKSKNPKNIAGVNAEESQQTIHNVRTCAATHCNPPIHLDVCQIRLKNGNYVLIIPVAKSYQTPHIHSSGAIYRRLHESSQPIKVQSEFQDLIDRKKRTEQLLFKKLTSQIDLLDQKRSFAFVNLVPVNSEELNLKLIPKDLKDFVNTKTYKGINITLDRAEYVFNGIKVSQRLDEPVNLPKYAINIFNDGSCRIEVPLNKYDLITIKNITTMYEVSHFERLIQLCRSKCILDSSQLIDFTYLYYSVTYGLYLYETFLNSIVDLEVEYYIAYEVINIGHTIPFVCGSKFLEQCEARGLPFNFQDNFGNISKDFSDMDDLLTNKSIEKRMGVESSEDTFQAIFAQVMAPFLISIVGSEDLNEAILSFITIDGLKNRDS